MTKSRSDPCFESMFMDLIVPFIIAGEKFREVLTAMLWFIWYGKVRTKSGGGEPMGMSLACPRDRCEKSTELVTQVIHAGANHVIMLPTTMIEDQETSTAPETAQIQRNGTGGKAEQHRGERIPCQRRGTQCFALSSRIQVV